MKHDARTQAAIDAGHPEWAKLPGSAAEARAADAKHFFTGRPCKHGHVGRRYTSAGNCEGCFQTPEARDRQRAYDKRPEVMAKNRQWQKDNREWVNAYAREWRTTETAQAYEKQYAQRPEVIERRRERDREKYAADEAHRERSREYLRERYRKPEIKAAHRDYMRGNTAEREARKIKATPDWLTAGQHDEIKVFFERAIQLTGETGIPHQVDHIVPLRHADVCGLHVPWNLQVLAADDNLAKGNSFDGTMDNEGWRVDLARAVAAE